MAANFKLNISNPLLDEDDDEGYSPQESLEEATPVAPTPPNSPEGLDSTYEAFFGEDDEEEVVAPTATHNPVDPRLGNLSGTPKPTSWKKKTAKKYRRRDITERDLTLLKFLALFKMSNSGQLAHLLGVKPNSAHKRLLGLQEAGLVQSKAVLGAKLLWFVRGKGLRLLEGTEDFDLSLVRQMNERDMETTQVGHYLAVNQVALQLLSGGNPLHLTELKGAPAVEQFVTEYQIASRWAAWKDEEQVQSHQLAALARKRRERVFAAKGAEEALETDAGLWTVLQSFGAQQTTSTYHHPDLVLRGSEEDGFRAVAIEVENSVKAVSEYKRIIETYLKDRLENDAVGRLYDKLVWVTNSQQAITRIDQAAEALGLLDEEFCRAVPLYDWDGNRFTDKGWRL